MGFFDNFGKDFVDGFIGTDYLEDYTHATKLMRSDNFALAPNTKFLFHVYFTLNPAIPNVATDGGLVGALVKTVQLPAFQLETEEYVQYNKKRNVYKRIKYQPVTMSLHDDASDTVRSLWHNYYRYYFADSDYPYNGPTTDPGQRGNGMAYSGRDIYNRNYTHPSWGMTTKNSSGLIKEAFFKDITIYGMSRGNYVSYTLINPIIESWTHDTYDYSQTGSTMEHKVGIRYEAVKYGRGKVSGDYGEASEIPGFGTPDRYDTSPSPLTKSGSTASIFGQAGALDTGLSAWEDLSNGNILGAFKKGASSVRTFKNSDLGFKGIVTRDLQTEAAVLLPGLLTNLGRKGGILFPKAKKDETSVKVNTPKKPDYYNDPDPDGNRKRAIEKAIAEKK